MKPTKRLLNWILSFFGRVWCDRCRRARLGLDSDRGFSIGVYVGWKEYMDAGEHIICDECMWKDERYLADYPHMRAKFRCTRCGKNEHEASAARCKRGPCPMDAA